MITSFREHLPHIFIPAAWDVRISLILWTLIVVIQMWGNTLLRPEVKYGLLSYRFTKTLISAIFGFIVTAILLGLGGTPTYRYGFTGVAVIMTVLDFMHIWRRNHSPIFLRGKTTMGLVDFEDQEEVKLILTEASAIIRHQLMDGREYASQESVEELLDSFGFPAGDEFAKELRRLAKERRERLARDKVFAADVEMLRKEING
jgi:signal transduction histidine kinase